jgi:sugar lactone lactonase YvrE
MLHLYVPNLDTNTITSYPLTTSGGNVRPSATISANNGSLSHPANQAFDSKGNLWVGNEESNTIVKFTQAQLATSGSPVPPVTISANNGSLESPEPTAFDAAGNLWVANARNNTIVKFTPAQLATSGSPVPQVTISANNGSLINPFVLTFDRAGDLWVTNRRANNIVEFTAGQLKRSGSPVPRVTILANNGSLYYPYTPVFDSSGNLWVTNQFGNTIVEYTQAQLATSGSPVPKTTIGDNSGSLNGPVGSVFDPSGNLWVATTRSTQSSNTNLPSSQQAGIHSLSSPSAEPRPG